MLDEELIDTWNQGLSRRAAARVLRVTEHFIQQEWSRLRREGLIFPRYPTTKPTAHERQLARDSRGEIDGHIHVGYDLLLTRLIDVHKEPRWDIPNHLRRKPP